ncbi:MBL fold metallo-hydrolase [Agrobacterium sp. NPDC090283]|uniref:MBL fold metallo-hydrolase n=1 Tax=Agrobacterium sp. NPDC090283 TaxID=3363920 RepID=UPI00383A9520
MQITQIRNATLRLDFGGVRFLIDPVLAEKGAYPGFAGKIDPAQFDPTDVPRHPMAELVVPMAQILDVDAAIVTHTHDDHWDEAAIRLVPKHLPLFVQNESDAQAIRGQGFEDVRILTTETTFNGVSLIKTPGQHGSDEAAKLMGDVMGVVFRHPEEKTLYIAGDTIWNDFVAQNLKNYTPDAIVVNAGFAHWFGVGPIIMGTEDVRKVCEAAPKATVIASHMEAVNHAELTRAALREDSDAHGYTTNLLIPADGETIKL